MGEQGIDRRATGARPTQLPRRAILLASTIVLTTLGLVPAGAQPPAPPSPGSIAPLPTPAPVPDGEAPISASVLPPLPTIGITVPTETTGYLGTVNFDGNEAFSDAQLEDVVRPFLGRSLTALELITLRDQVAARYQTAGYLATRVTLGSPALRDGELHVLVHEGTLDPAPCVRVLQTDALAPQRDGSCTPPPRRGRLQPTYVLARLPDRSGALNIDTLRDALTQLQLDARVQRLDAALTPGVGGDAKLDLLLWEASPWRVAAEVGNTVSPSLGGLLGGVSVEHLNVSGRGDAFSATVRGAEGLITAEGAYSLPVLGGYSRLGLAARGGWSEVVEAPFDALDLTGRTSTFELRMDIPVLRGSPSRSLDLAFALVQRSSSSFVFGDPFAFTDSGDNGAYRLSIIRASQSWLRRSARQALAARSTLSVGTAALKATRRTRDGEADGQFVAWRGQVQWARTLRWRSAVLIARADVQLAGDPLFGLESFTLGGSYSVRGYRENELIRDSGASAGLEARIPVLKRGRHRLALALFSDAGRAWDVGDEDEQALWSIGAGLRWDHPRINVSLYAGKALSERPTANTGNLQDNGIHLSIRTAR